jgi:hypothetical protein
MPLFKPRVTPQELGESLFRFLTLKRTRGTPLTEVVAGLAGCRGLNLDSERVLLELKLLAACAADYQLGQLVRLRTISQEQSNTALEAYIKGLTMNVATLAPQDLVRLLRDRIPAYYESFNAWLYRETRPTNGRNPVAEVFAKFCGVDVPHEGLVAQVQIEAHYLFAVTTGVLENVKIK